MKAQMKTLDRQEALDWLLLKIGEGYKVTIHTSPHGCAKKGTKTVYRLSWKFKPGKL